MPEDHVKVQIADDRSKAVVTFSPDAATTGGIEVSAAQLLEMIHKLGRAHQSMVEDREIPALKGQTIHSIFNTRWFVNPELMGEACVLSFYHTAFGPVGFVMPLDQIEKMASILMKQIEAAKQDHKARPN
jgi:hypothetical protein